MAEPKKLSKYFKKIDTRMGGVKKAPTKEEIHKGLGKAPKKPPKRSRYAD